MLLTTVNGTGRQSPARVAALHALPDGWSVVVASSEGDRFSIVAAERLSTGDGAGVRRLMSTHRADRLVRVIPASETIVRCVSLPAGDSASSQAALTLMAEAQLPTAIETHRHGAARMPLPGIDDGHAGLLAGWFGETVPDRILGDDDEETWAPSAAALSWLLALAQDRNVATDTAWGVAKEGSDAACVAVSDASGTRVRAGRIGDPQRVLDEMRVDTQLPAGQRVTLDPHATEALKAIAPKSGVSVSWMDQHAIAAGAAIGALSGGGPLFGILAEPPKYHYTLKQKAALWMTERRNVRALIAIGLLLIFVAPVALVYARHETLKAKLATAQEALGPEAQAEVDELVRNAAFADELLTHRLPYAKVLSAVADALPVGDSQEPLGVQIERIDIGPERISMRGEASSLSVIVSGLEPNLRKAPIFTNVLPSPKADGDRASFSLTADITRINANMKSENGYAATPFAVRLWGEEAQEFDYASLESQGEEDGDSSRNGRRSNSGSSSRTASLGGPAEEAANPIPEVLGQEKISQLNWKEARAAFSERRRAASRDDIDEETKRLLAEDVEMLRAHIPTVRGN